MAGNSYYPIIIGKTVYPGKGRTNFAEAGPFQNRSPNTGLRNTNTNSSNTGSRNANTFNTNSSNTRSLEANFTEEGGSAEDFRLIEDEPVQASEIGSEPIQITFNKDDLLRGLIYSEILSPPKSRRRGR